MHPSSASGPAGVAAILGTRVLAPEICQAGPPAEGFAPRGGLPYPRRGRSLARNPIAPCGPRAATLHLQDPCRRSAPISRRPVRSFPVAKGTDRTGSDIHATSSHERRRAGMALAATATGMRI